MSAEQMFARVLSFAPHLSRSSKPLRFVCIFLRLPKRVLLCLQIVLILPFNLFSNKRDGKPGDFFIRSFIRVIGSSSSELHNLITFNRFEKLII